MRPGRFARTASRTSSSLRWGSASRAAKTLKRSPAAPSSVGWMRIFIVSVSDYHRCRPKVLVQKIGYVVRRSISSRLQHWKDAPEAKRERVGFPLNNYVVGLESAAEGLPPCGKKSETESPHRQSPLGRCGAGSATEADPD